jgi:MFS family permease
MEATLKTGLNLRGRARFIGLLAGFSAGLLNAIVARILMRVIALLMFGRGSFSLGGTAVIFMFGALVGPLFGLLYRATLYEIHATDLVKGLLFGLVLMVALQVPVLFIFPEFRAELMVAGSLGFAIFAMMNFSFVLTLAGIVAWLEKTWPRDATRQRSERIAATALGLLALAGLVLLLVEIVGRPLGFIE